MDANQKSEIARQIGARIRAARQARGWNQTVLAEKMGLSNATVSCTEAGKNGMPKQATIERYAEVLGVTPASLRDGESLPTAA